MEVHILYYHHQFRRLISALLTGQEQKSLTGRVISRWSISSTSAFSFQPLSFPSLFPLVSVLGIVVVVVVLISVIVSHGRLISLSRSLWAIRVCLLE